MPSVVERPAGNALALIERPSTKSLRLGHDEACPSSLKLTCIILAVLEGAASPAPKLFPKLGFKFRNPLLPTRLKLAAQILVATVAL